MAGAAASGLPVNAVWLPQLRSVVCNACQALIGSKPMGSLTELGAYGNSIYTHYRYPKEGHTPSPLKPIMNALAHLYSSAVRDYPKPRMFQPSHVPQIALSELPVHLGFYCPAALTTEKCPYASRSFFVVQNHCSVSKHGKAQDIHACACTLQAGWYKSLVRVIRPVAQNVGSVAPTATKSDVDLLHEQTKGAMECDESLDDTTSESGNPGPGSRRAQEVLKRKQSHAGANGIEPSRVTWAEDSHGGERDLTLMKRSRDSDNSAWDANADSDGNSASSDAETETALKAKDETRTATFTVLESARAALVTAGWTEAELDEPAEALADIARKLQLQRKAIAASYVSNVARVARVLGIPESKLYHWRSIHLSMTTHAMRWAQAPSNPFVASVRDFPMSLIPVAKPVANPLPPNQPSHAPPSVPPSPIRAPLPITFSPSPFLSSNSAVSDSGKSFPFPAPCVGCSSRPPSALCIPCLHVIYCDRCILWKPTQCKQCGMPLTKILVQQRLFRPIQSSSYVFLNLLPWLEVAKLSLRHFFIFHERIYDRNLKDEVLPPLELTYAEILRLKVSRMNL